MKIRYAGNTHVGMKRTHNEDNLFLLPEEDLFIVADGMGGHSCGEVASQVAVEGVAQFFKDTSTDSEITWPFKAEKDKNYHENRLSNSVKLANLKIFEASVEDPKKKGMGTTIVVLKFTEENVMTANVGDSRIYRHRQGKLVQITEDHSLLNDYLKMKELTPEEIENFPHKNVIVRALGMKEAVQVDILTEQYMPKDIYLMCSDGLSGMITDPDMQQILNETGDDLELGCNRLIQTANQNGGNDNVTVVLAQYLPD